MEILSHALGHRMDDLSYFKEEREWAARENMNKERRKPGDLGPSLERP